MRRLAGAIILAAFLVSLLLCPLAVSQGNRPAHPLTKEKWREDLRYFARELAKRHKNLYHAVSRGQFEQAVADLDAAIPSLPDHQIIVRMKQIAARVGDGHTGLRFPAYFHRYPIALYWFGGELRVTGAAGAYQRALGTRVVKIGSTGIDEVHARIRLASLLLKMRTSGT